jgi:DNA polymerase-3 subunit delta'
MTELPSPIANPNLIGHAAAEATFLDAWSSGRLAHAWLITGPRGIGKATLAYRIARFVLAGGGQGGLFGGPTSLDIPADGALFRRIAANGHADLKAVERSWSDDKMTKRSSEILVKDVRDVGSFMALTPAEGGWRVVVIDAADEMNRSSANAILKVLEEPPKRALMLLVSHSPGRLLPTIRSRCRRLNLRPLTDSQVIDLLHEARPDLNDADAAALAQLAEGSIGRALALGGEGGLELYRDLVKLLTSLPKLDIPALHGFADKVSGRSVEQGDSFRTVTELLTWWLARLVRAGGRASQPPEVVPGESMVMSRLLRAGSLEQWVEVWEKVSHLFARAEAVNLDRKQVVLEAFLMVERLARS